jgi:hypothetical protein
VRPYLEKPFTKIGLVEWFKMEAKSSSPSSTKRKQKRKKERKEKKRSGSVGFKLKASHLLDSHFST